MEEALLGETWSSGHMGEHDAQWRDSLWQGHPHLPTPSSRGHKLLEGDGAVVVFF